MIQQRNKNITKNIYFIQEKSVDINKTVKCEIFSEVLLIDGTYNSQLQMCADVKAKPQPYI